MTEKKVFWAISRSNPHDGELQGIIETDGTITLGIDAWRTLNKHDCASFPTKKFTSLAQMQRDYRMVKIRRGYYMPGEEAVNGLQQRRS